MSDHDDDHGGLNQLPRADPILRALLTAAEACQGDERPFAGLVARTVRALLRIRLGEVAAELDDDQGPFDRARRLLERANAAAAAVPLDRDEEKFFGGLPSAPLGKRRADAVRQLRSRVAKRMKDPSQLDDADFILEGARLLGLGLARHVPERDVNAHVDTDDVLDSLDFDEDEAALVERANREAFRMELDKALRLRSKRPSPEDVDDVLRLTLRALGMGEREANSLLRAKTRIAPKSAKRAKRKSRRTGK
jgi:hypothetical protein